MEESMDSVESFENFKGRIELIFKSEGLSENLLLEIKNWSERRQKETEMSGVTIEQRITFQLELAQIYGVTERYDESWDVLSDVWSFADNLKDQELTREVEKWMDTIHIKKE